MPASSLSDKRQWPIVLTETTQDRRTNRANVRPPFLHRLIGSDGRLLGGERPFPGFLNVYEPDFFADPNHDATSEITFFRHVDFLIGSDGYGFGVVYRATRSLVVEPLGDTADVFVDFWSSKEDTTSFGTVGELVATGVSPTADISVEVVGRFVFIFITGRSPAMFYVEETIPDTTDPPTYAIRKFGNILTDDLPGPGKQPSLFSPDDPEAVPLGEMPIPAVTEENRPGHAQIVLTDKKPSETGLYGLTPDLPDDPVPTEPLDPPEVGPTPTVQQVKFATAQNGTLVQILGVNVQAGDHIVCVAHAEDNSLGDRGDVAVSWSGHTGFTRIGNIDDPTLQFNSQALFLKATTTATGFVNVKWITTYQVTRMFAAVIVVRGAASIHPEIIGTVHNDVEDPRLSLVSPLDNTLAITQHAVNIPNPAGEVPVCTEQVDTDDGTNGYFVQTTTMADHGVEYLCGYDTTEAVTPPDWMHIGVLCLPPILVPPDTSILLDPPPIVSVQLLSPLQLATEVALDANLRYVARDANGDAIDVGDADYEIFLGTDATADPLPSVGGPVTAQEFDPGDLNALTAYYWYVEADNVNTAGPIRSARQQFITVSIFNSRLLPPGGYSFAYQLEDSDTGRKSGLSVAAQARSDDFTGVDGTTTGDRRVALELIYDSDKYDRLRVYRSVKIEDAGGVFVAGFLHLDAVVDLDEYHTVTRNGTGLDFDPVSTDFRHAVYWYQLDDLQLPFQDIYEGSAQHDETMPKGGSAAFYEGTLIVADIIGRSVSSSDEPRIGDTERGIGEIRYSELHEVSPELFSPLARKVPRTPNDSVIALKEVTPNVLGWAKGRMQHISKTGTAIQINEMHAGFGIVNQRAVDVVGPLAFFVTDKGLKTVNSQGALNDFRTMDGLLLDDWKNDLTSISIAYDPTLSSLFVLNPNKEHVAIVWFNTLKQTEVLDCPFTQVTQGKWPRDPTLYTSPLSDRAMFLQNTTVAGTTSVPAGYTMKPRIFVVDHLRTKTVSGGTYDGQSRVSLLGPTKDLRFNVITLSGDTLTLENASTLLGDKLEGCKVYVIKSGTDDSLYGAKSTIIYKDGNDLKLDADVAALAGLDTGDRVAISPVYFRTEAGPLDSGITPEDRPDFLVGASTSSRGQDFFRQRKVSQVGASFIDVAGSAVAESNLTDNRYRSLVFRNLDAGPAASAFPTNVADQIIDSVVNGPAVTHAELGDRGVDGTVLAPAIEVICPDLDFLLMEILAEGRIETMTRESNT